MAWHSTSRLNPKVYVCGYCHVKVGPNSGYFPETPTGRAVYICSNCDQPTYFDEHQRQFPGVKVGGEVNHLPVEIKQLYEEARSAMSSQGYTPAVLACRKILMNVAVHLGANEGNSFVNYVQFLAEKGFIPPNGRHWVDHIRTKSNEANHEITLMSKDEGETLITFTEMMLKFIYELPNAVPKSSPVSSP